MKQIKFFTLTFISILMLSSSSFAMWRPHHNYKYGYGIRQMHQFTDEEQKALKKARLEFIKETRSLRTKIFNTRLDLKIALASDNPDPSEVKKLRKTLDAAIKQFQEKKRLHFKKINEIVPGFDAMGRHQMRSPNRYQCPPPGNDPI